jgi:hypothetical protein
MRARPAWRCTTADASPVLQFEIRDHNWQTWRVDFARPERRVAVEYDGFD